MNTLSITSKDGTSKFIPIDKIDNFKEKVHGELITPTNDRYESARKLWNGMIDKKPALIARCKGVADVITAVNFSKEHNLLFSIRGGGHNVAGTAIAEWGLVVDLSAMRSISVDPEQRGWHTQKAGCSWAIWTMKPKNSAWQLRWVWSRRLVWPA